MKNLEIKAPKIPSQLEIEPAVSKLSGLFENTLNTSEIPSERFDSSARE